LDVDGEPPALSETVDVVPSAALPEEVQTQMSHNNLDAVWHGGRLYLAFRAAPTHFAGTEVVLYVLSTDDHASFRFETRVALGRDVREPRFLVLGDELHLFFAVLGTNELAFEPQGTRVMTLQSDCSWSEPERVLPPGFILWRARPLDDGSAAYVSGYVGGGSLYSGSEDPLQVHWLRTEDARAFEPASGDSAVVLQDGSSEMDFAWRGDGGVVAVSRNEGGDERGFGSRLCRAGPADLSDWTCATDVKKYDSPLLFPHGDELYLLARRNDTETGAYDLGLTDLTFAEQVQRYQLVYWALPKRCALWRVHEPSLEVEHLLDLPSAGDTCFPALIPLGDSRYLVYNYTSPLEEPDLPWYEGQARLTSIYAVVLRLP
jgi:hypothetical protein